jgi:CheY-like chemotaxis protein
LGNLADLGLGDIFQIVSLSRRSGTLQLTTSTESGEIVFDNGRVVAAFTTGEKETVGERMLAAGVVPPTAYQEMLAAQAEGSDGRELFEAFGFEPDRLADALQKILETTIYDMFEWDDGTFSFVLEDKPDPWRGFSLVGTRIVSQRGLNPQYLAIEGARIRDERTQDDSLDAFLARDKPRAPGLLTREADVRTFAAKLRESPAEAPEHDKVIPFPGGRARRDAVPTAAAEAVAEPESAPEAVAVAVEVPVEPAEAAVPSPALAVEAEQPAPVAEAASQPAPVAEAASQPAPVEALPSDPVPAPEATVAPEAETAPWRLLAVDDDPQVTRQLLSTFASHFAAVASSNTVVDALLEIENGPSELVIASDLIIARSDGAGILGGIEILERVRERSPTVPVVLFTDYENAEAQKRAAELGVSGFLMKPRKAQIQGTAGGEVSPAMQRFLDELSGALGPYLAAPRVEAAPPVESTGEVAEPEVTDHEVELVEPLAGLVSPSAPQPPPPQAPGALDGTAADPAAETEHFQPGGDDAPVSPADTPIETTLPYDLRREMAGVIEEIEVPGSEELPPPQDSSGPVSTLRSMLAELVDPANRDTVTLLVLRFASLVFERAALFLVTRRAYIGLGGFALHESSDLFVMRVRRIQIPVHVDSVFAKVTRFRATLRGPLEQNQGNQLLVSGLGNAWPASGAVAMPLVSNERVAAILYGDNPSGRTLGSTDTLEIFLQQAGLAMDRVLLERKLEEARRRGTE